ncbi:MAG: ABC transporter ATP-binding protein, partial [Peptostreptococcaceae bacterium]|nr:ABC transporter ATP-binding protein [Peptostreptococcaceae bacterium]
YFSYFVIVAFSAYLVIEKDFNAGEFFIAINMIDQLSYPLIALSGCIQNIISVKDLNKSVTGYYGDTLEVRGIKQKVINQFKSKIEFKNVKFSYDENKAILQDISLSFEKGKKYLIKGPSGTGKTTLINLLLKYYKPTDGIISIDDMDIQEITTMYDIATVVRQDNFLFNDTLRNNLTLYQDISDEKLLEALEKVQLGKFANIEGLNMVVGNGGNLFSGGERKRICIARALLTNKEVLILDEPLANLDTENIEKLEERILDLKNYTIIMITHIISEEAEMKFDKVINLEIR